MTIKFSAFKTKIQSSRLVESTTESIAESEVPLQLILDSIQKHHDIRVTDTLIESYTELLRSKEFNVDPVIADIKQFNTLGRYEFELSDGSHIAITEETYLKLRSLLDNKYDIIDYMKESIDNFKKILREIKD